MTLSENALLTAHRQKMVNSGWINSGAMRAFARRCIEAFDVRCGGSEALAQSLSGGNLQKYIMGREILQAPKVLVVAQPTWASTSARRPSFASSCSICRQAAWRSS